ncbi:MAG TPA: sulfite exporter TauE/SafE family protein [Aliidongia sp.]|nr:sulfite exporter TauE/SafE family protein [Aliidongia sp.]
MVLTVSLLTFLLAGFVKGVIGLGLPTVAVGLLGLVMPPAQAAALLIIPSFVTNVWQLVTGPAFRPLLRRFWTLLFGICLGTLIGGWLGAGVGKSADAWLGAALLAYAALGLSRLNFSVSPRFEPILSPVIGVATGLVTGVTGVFVVPAVPYLQALELERDDLVQALGLSFTVSTVALAGSLAHSGLLGGPLLGWSLAVLVPALAGMAIGQWARNKISAQTFRTWFFIGLAALGIDLVAQAAF